MLKLKLKHLIELQFFQKQNNAPLYAAKRAIKTKFANFGVTLHFFIPLLHFFYSRKLITNRYLEFLQSSL